MAVCVLTPLVAFAVAYALTELPEPAATVNDQAAVLTYADGTEYARLAVEGGNRTRVPLAAIPQHVQQAVLAAEDGGFFTHQGFDLAAILRATWKQLTGGSGGGSTITQQYVKTALVGNEHSLSRKLRELVLSIKLETVRTKDQILEDYLNTIYLGRGAYGVEAAAHAYFDRPVSELTLEQGAVIAGLIPAPSRWDPGLDGAQARVRWTFVLDRMVQEGWITPAQRAAARFPVTAPRNPVRPGLPTDSRGHVVAAVLRELEDAGISDDDLRRGGLRIVTTLDRAAQDAAVRSAAAHLDGQPRDLRAAVVAITPGDGGIAAYDGGPDGQGLDYARVLKQPGSTFKPFVTLAALEHDPPIGLGTVFRGAERPGLRNAEGAGCERCDLKQATTVSNNVVFVDLATDVGPEAVADAAHRAGVTAALDDPDAAIALGNREVSPVQLASAYATILGGGVWNAPHLVTRVTDGAGAVVPDRRAAPERRFAPDVARNAVESMLDVAPHDGIDVGRPTAAKTGTVQSRASGQNKDAWMAGGTPGTATVVWVGTDRNTPIRTADGTPVQGSTTPAQIWRDVVATAAAGEPLDPTDMFGELHPIGRPPSDLWPGAPADVGPVIAAGSEPVG